MRGKSQSLGFFLFILLSAAILAALGLSWQTRLAPPDRDLTHIEVQRLAFKELPGWADDPKAGALKAFQLSCRRLRRWPDNRPLSKSGLGGFAKDWKPVCARAIELPDADDQSAHKFFVDHFNAYQITSGSENTGLFTGYYEPLLNGSRIRSERYNIPLYKRPPDLVSVNLGSFEKSLQGKHLRGQVKGGRLIPYADRQQISAGALQNRNLELVYVDNAIDAFFLHIQGSGRVKLDTGEIMGVGYNGQNGRKYVAIGRDLIQRGAIPRDKVSMQSIRAWLHANPNKQKEIFNLNPSFIFFREIPAKGAIGALGVVLTPGRSLAVDRSRIPLAAPLFLATKIPSPDAEDQAWRRLMVAQDVGGAIKGTIRGDIFFGNGSLAAYRAGHMKGKGRIYLLLPKELSAKVN